MLVDYFKYREIENPEREAVELMRAFPGIVLRMPDVEQIERIAKEVQIVDVLSKRPGTETVRCIASLHGQKMQAITKTFSRRTGRGLTTLRQPQRRVSRMLGATRRKHP